jgi:hypothetical protein
MDKDCKVRFKELLSKKTRKKTGDEETPLLDELGDGSAGPE